MNASYFRRLGWNLLDLPFYVADQALEWLNMKARGVRGSGQENVFFEEGRPPAERTYYMAWKLVFYFCARLPEMEYEIDPQLAPQDDGRDRIFRRMANYPDEAALLRPIARANTSSFEDYLAALEKLHSLLPQPEGHPNSPDWDVVFRILIIEALRFMAAVDYDWAIDCFNANYPQYAKYNYADSEESTAEEKRRAAYYGDRNRVSKYLDRIGVDGSTLLSAPQPKWWRVHSQACWARRRSVDANANGSPPEHEGECPKETGHTDLCKLIWIVEWNPPFLEPAHSGDCLYRRFLPSLWDKTEPMMRAWTQYLVSFSAAAGVLQTDQH